MVPIQIDSIEEELDDPSVAPLAFELVAKAQTMGFMPSGAGRRVKLDRRFLTRVARVLEADGVAVEPGARLRRASRGRLTEPLADRAELERALADVLSAVAASPRPHGEWGPARELLGDELLARILGGLSMSSLRRYAAGTRATPDEVAWRLHVVATILSFLLGSYNDYGVRRWFERPRSRLHGASPAETLSEASDETDVRLREAVALAVELAA